MSTARQKRKPVFDPSALDDDLDDLLPARPAAAAPQAAPEPLAAAPATPPAVERPNAAAAPPVAPQATLNRAVAQAPPQAPLTRPPSGAPSDQPRHLATVTAVPGSVGKRTRPPEVLLSSEVYDELYRVQIAEKKVRRGLARTMGTIVLDAIEAHAPRLATTWTTERFAVGEGQLFERPSSNAVPRRRRHATAPRTVVLSGVTAANGQRLDNLVQAWGAGTRSALVEQALRYEFGLLPT
ncbi:hypothetical protein HZU40_00625 (plasmid) [Mycolicibacterium fluoranthenivorans]|uniref:Uncharacterized protein n=1 Tax=Mycolicibacterium fluoranthenivorans TaxID=258505 RepID=A0A7G8P6M8_9MYCO|nr:hypothetical protein HZU40_00625 [Mycolicibacterium fluoranthenivorans]